LKIFPVLTDPGLREPGVELRPDPVVGPIVDGCLRVALEVQPLHAGRPGGDQYETTFGVGVDELIGRRWRLGEDPEPGERVLPEEVRTDLALGNEVPGIGARTVGTDHEVALQRPLLVVVGEPDSRLVGVEAVDLGVAHTEPDVATVCEPLGNEVDEHLVLGVHHDRPTTGQLIQVDPVQSAGVGQVDAVVDEAVAHHPVPTPVWRNRSTVPCSRMPALIVCSMVSRVWRSITTESTPRWCSRCDSSNPAGPAPTIPT
jgi:hypothetical protein